MPTSTHAATHTMHHNSTPARVSQSVAVVGAGWYGCHISLELSKKGYAVTLFEKNTQILSECSGLFGIRLHRGPHYPRSRATREHCKESFEKFRQEYRELVVESERSLYAYGRVDALGYPSKVSVEEFETVCLETKGAHRVDETVERDFEGVESVYELNEPSVVVGEKLRRYFLGRFEEARGIKVEVNTRVLECLPTGAGHTIIHTQPGERPLALHGIDWIVNATGFTDLLSCKEKTSISLVLGLQIVYQPCIAFRYTDLAPGKKPFSFIVMDGWYPCLMPLIDERDDQYILTHGCYTILGSYSTHGDATRTLKELPVSGVLDRLRDNTERDMQRFWPAFKHRFVYCGWQGAVLAKPRSGSEYRSSLVFGRSQMIHVVPGKISTVFKAADDVFTLMETQSNVIEDVNHGWRYVMGGSLGRAKEELGCPSMPGERRTDELQTLRAFSDFLHAVQVQGS